MNKKHKFIDSKRRGFLQGSAVLTATAVAGGTTAANAATESAKELLPEAGDARSADAGYRETDRVREYYRKARMV